MRRPKCKYYPPPNRSRHWRAKHCGDCIYLWPGDSARRPRFGSVRNRRSPNVSQFMITLIADARPGSSDAEEPIHRGADCWILNEATAEAKLLGLLPLFVCRTPSMRSLLYRRKEGLPEIRVVMVGRRVRLSRMFAAAPIPETDTTRLPAESASECGTRVRTTWDSPQELRRNVHEMSQR